MKPLDWFNNQRAKKSNRSINRYHPYIRMAFQGQVNLGLIHISVLNL